jgi:hypothetical protein
MAPAGDLLRDTAETTVVERPIARMSRPERYIPQRRTNHAFTKCVSVA